MVGAAALLRSRGGARSQAATFQIYCNHAIFQVIIGLGDVIERTEGEFATIPAARFASRECVLAGRTVERDR